MSRRRVARLMRALGLQGVTRRKRRCTTRRDPQATVAPDRVQRRFEASEPNRLWVADITYVPTLEGFVYLATVLDVFSRKVVGWAMSARQTVDLGAVGAGDGGHGAGRAGWSIYEVSDYLGCGSYGSRVVPEVECTS